jgi:hypothetical protein
VSGRVVHEETIMGESMISVKHLVSGAYVAKTKSYSIKLMVK